MLLTGSHILNPLRNTGWLLREAATEATVIWGRTDLVEVGVLCGCEAEAALPALEGHEAGQQAEGNVHVIAKVVLHVVCHGPQAVGQLLGFNCVQLSLVPLQAL